MSDPNDIDVQIAHLLAQRRHDYDSARKQALEEAEAEARRYVHEPDKQTNQFYEGMTYAKETIVARISALAAKGQP